MLRLYVMRHAKSSWAAPGARDFDRELNERGILDLVKISQALQARKYCPELVLCSAATRTRLTLEGITDAFSSQPAIIHTEKLYSSGLEDYMRLVNETENVSSMMIVGHNPMCGSLAVHLAGHGDPDTLDKIAYKYPTGAISVLDFDVADWSKIAPQSGTLSDLIIPSEL
ncbi:MAG: histidine phosphatase family protein [Pseudomonadota bacterium]